MAIENVTVKEKWKFRKIKQTLDVIQLFAGCPIYEPSGLNKYWRYHGYFIKFNMRLYLFEAVYCILTGSHESLPYVISQIYIFTIGFTCEAIYLNQIFTRPQCVQLLNWIADLPEKSSYFFDKKFKKILKQIKKYLTLTFKYIPLFTAPGFICIILIQVPVETFILGKHYFLPLRCEMPFLPVTNIYTYWINLIHQAYATLVGAFYGVGYFAFVISVLLSIIIHLDAIKFLMGNMRQGLAEGDFNAWLKQVASEVRDVKIHLDIFTSDIFIVICYFFEKLTYSCFVLLWLAIKVDKDLMPYAFESVYILILTLSFAILNEIIKQKIDDLLEVLYDQPWDELPPPQRRLLVPLIVDLQRPIGITTGIEDVTLDWYSRIIKAAYSMGLVLEEFITT